MLIEIVCSYRFSVPTELYGPLVTSLTLVAVLQMNMKTSNTSLEEATLIETALTTCFGYWAFLTGVIIGLSYLCSTYINKIQVLIFLDCKILKNIFRPVALLDTEWLVTLSSHFWLSFSIPTELHSSCFGLRFAARLVPEWLL